MKKLLALLLVLVMVGSMFAACNNGGKPATNDGTTASTGGDANVEATWPEDLTLTVGIPQNSSVEDYDTNAFTLWLEEESGIDLEFELYMPMENDYKSKLSTAMVSGDELPDVLFGFNLGRKYYQDLGEDGYLVDLAPYFEDRDGVSKIWWDRFETLDEYYQSLVLRNLWDDEEDNIWAMPRVENSTYDVQDHQAFINHVWLEKLSLEMPQSPDDLYKVLKAFKTQDPNGNSKADEIPLIGRVGNGYGDPVDWIINMFIYHSNQRSWRVEEDGSLTCPYTTDEYREALIFIRKLVDEGLMATSCWTSVSNATIKGLMSPLDGVATAGIVLGHPTLCFVPGAETMYEYSAVDYFGYAAINTDAYDFKNFITTDCEYPDAAWHLFMVMSTEEGSFRSRYGEKGKDWVDADPGTTSFLGRPAKIKVLNESAFGGTNNECWNGNYVGLFIDSENEACQLTPDMGEWVNYKMKLMKDTVDSYYAAAERTPENVVPALTYTVEEDEEIAAARSNTQNVYNTARASFCTGTSSNGKYTNPKDDAQWAAYLQEMIDQGYEEWRDMAAYVYSEMVKNGEG